MGIITIVAILSSFIWLVFELVVALAPLYGIGGTAGGSLSLEMDVTRMCLAAGIVAFIWIANIFDVILVKGAEAKDGEEESASQEKGEQ